MSNNADTADVSKITIGAVNCPASLDTLPTDEFLRVVGLRVRAQRSTLSMSRKRLAEVSGVSERYLAQLESGQGNMSIALLRKVTSAIGMSLGALLSAEVPECAEQAAANQSESVQSGCAVSGNPAHTMAAHEERRLNSEHAQRDGRLVPEL